MAEPTVLTPTDNQQTPDNQTPAGNTQVAPEGEKGKPQVAPADWRSGLSPELRGEKMFENIKAKDAVEALPILAKGYRDSQRLLGGSLGRLPGKDAKPEEVAKWKADNLGKLSAAGLIDAAPAESSGYTAKIIKGGVPQELPAGALDTVFKEFHQMGLTDKQAQGMLDLYTRQQDSLGGTVQESMAALTKEWGAGTKEQIKVAQRAVESVGGEELMSVLETTGLGNHPALIKAFAKVGHILSEDDPIFLDTVRNGAGETQAAKNAILRDKKHAYWNKEDPGHAAAVAEVGRLNEILTRTEGKD